MKLNEITKDEFKKRLEDPRRSALDKKLKEFDDILRNRIGWRLKWEEWKEDSKVFVVTAYRPKTIPYASHTVEDIRNYLWTFLLQDRWDEKNDIEITLEHESKDAVTWEFYLV